MVTYLQKCLNERQIERRSPPVTPNPHQLMPSPMSLSDSRNTSVHEPARSGNPVQDGRFILSQ